MKYTQDQMKNLVEKFVAAVKSGTDWNEYPLALRQSVEGLLEPDKIEMLTNSVNEKKQSDVARLTSLSVSWFDCGLIENTENTVVRERIKVFRTQRPRLEWSQYNEKNKRINRSMGHLPAKETEDAFSQFENIFGAYEDFDRSTKTDYSVEVCDGSQWELRLRYSVNPEIVIRGTIELPPYGEQIKDVFHRLIERADSWEGCPRIFGI